MESIKLVIWDLDETFWNGTLSEGDIEFIDSNIELVKELSRRGIINSIVSKNDFAQARSRLIDAGVWEYFIFPVINWNPKGQQVSSVIEDCQLRPQNVLFIDDNPVNLQEVLFYNKGIEVAPPPFIKEIQFHESFRGKDDEELTRLKQYKVLEEKKLSRLSHSSNEEFLSSSKISIFFNFETGALKDRILELVNRSNQLNFTKTKLTETQFDEFARSPDYSQAAIKVTDRFGDYGVVGYYCISKVTNTLLQFVFSCRVINLGIEQYVYERLNFPDLSTIGPVVTVLKQKKMVNWIQEGGLFKNETRDEFTDKKIVFKGGCDMDQLIHYIKSKELEIRNEGNGVKENVPLHSDHSQVLLDSLRLTELDKRYLADTLPFVDESFYTTSVFTSDYDVLVFSVLMDYTMDLYRHREKGYIVPYGGYYDRLTVVEDHPRLVTEYAKHKLLGFTEEFLAYFFKTYEFIGQITPEDFLKNLNTIRAKLSPKVSIIFLNGAELESPLKKESDARQRHISMNRVLDQFIETHENNYLLDVRKIIKDQRLLTNNLRHYKREVYFELSTELKRILEVELGAEVQLGKPTLIKNIFRETRRYLNKIDNRLSVNNWI